MIAIITILASLILPACLRAYTRAKEFGEDMDASDIIYSVRHSSLSYCLGHPRFQFATKAEFVEKCVLAPKSITWVQASKTEFVPFSYFDPTNKVVMIFHYGRKQAGYYAFTRGELSVPRE